MQFCKCLLFRCLGFGGVLTLLIYRRQSTVRFCKWLLFRCLGFGGVLALLILQEAKHSVVL